MQALHAAMRRVFRLTAWFSYNRKHAAPAYPDEIYEVPTERVAWRARREPKLSKLVNSAIVGGDWDIERERIDEDVVYRSFADRFLHGRPWKETPYFEYLRGSVTEHGAKTDLEIERRCARLDELYAFLRTSGYKRQQVLEAESKLVIVHPGQGFLPPEFREISVNVARDGSLLLRGGFHRLSMAKILAIGVIPVRIAVRHVDWQRLRDAVASGARCQPGLKDHPDLRNLFERYTPGDRM